MKPVLKITSALLCGAVMTMAFTTARAENNSYLPAPFVPWLQSQGYEQESETKNAVRRTQKINYKSLRDVPDNAVLSPRDTLTLIKNMSLEGADLNIEQPSPLEDAYSNRIIEELHQFGYEMFAGKQSSANEQMERGASRHNLPAGAVQDDFVLGMGDSLHITFRGQRSSNNIYEINSEGLLIIDDLAPISAAGRTIGQVREILEETAQDLHNTDVYVSLDKIRQIDVLVLGHVQKPGRQTLTVFHTVLDALNYAEGVQKTGSMRQIKLIRGGRSTIIDLYGLLIHGSTNMDLALKDGDKLVIPPIGPTVAVAGGVKRPAIYEILPHMKGMLSKPHITSRKMNLEEMLELGGGVLTPGQNRYIKLGLTADGQETVTDINSPLDKVFGDGSILMVSPSVESRAGTIELVGHTRRPGLHDIDKSSTLSELLDNERVLGPDIYPLIGVIERWNDEQMTREMLAFPPLLVVKGQFDRKLQDGDVIHLFSRDQITALQKPHKDDLKPEDIEPAVGSAMNVPEKLDPVLVSFLTERAAFIRGAVRQEGAYPVAEGTSLENLIAVAGGLTLEATTRNIEVTSALLGEGHQTEGRSGTLRKHINFAEDSPADVILQAGDTVRVNQKFNKVADNSVLLIGQVRHPGRYDLMPGDKMSDLIDRAGGLTQQAYAEGAIFSRESERRAEESRFRAAARDMERALAVAMDDEDKAPDTTQIAMARDLAAELRQVEAVGRITVEADPGILDTQPELDILLESGDRLYIPQRPLTVRVAGEVLSPASLQFRKEKNPRDYVAEAGGYTYHADKDRVFVLYPDGSAQPLQLSMWNHNAVMIPPGSTIVVPRDPKPFDFIQSARDVSQILSNLAITGIFLDDIRDD